MLGSPMLGSFTAAISVRNGGVVSCCGPKRPGQCTHVSVWQFSAHAVDVSCDMDVIQHVLGLHAQQPASTMPESLVGSAWCVALMRKV